MTKKRPLTPNDLYILNFALGELLGLTGQTSRGMPMPSGATRQAEDACREAMRVLGELEVTCETKAL